MFASLSNPSTANPLVLQQAESVRSNLGTTLALGSAVALCAGLLLAEIVEPFVAAAWTLTFLSTGLLRFLLLVWSRRLLPNWPRTFLAVCASGTLAGGLLWAAVPWLLQRHMAEPETAFVYVLMASTVAGHVVRTTTSALVMLAYALPILISAAVFTLAGDANVGALVFAGSLIVFLAILVVHALANERRFLESRRLAEEQQALAASLAVAAAEAREAQARFAYMAEHDPLTGLLNRYRLQAVMRAEIAAQRPFALLLIDLDNFKTINDTEGHLFGDATLVEVARILSEIRPQPVAVGRLGGDEFAVVAACGADTECLQNLANNLLNRLGTTVTVKGLSVRCSGSVGVSIYPRDGSDPEDLLASADIALYAAKGAGKHQAKVFDRTMGLDIGSERRIEAEIEAAIESREITVHFQPQVALDSGRLCGFEALLRWNHPEFGFVAPPRIVAAARRHGLSKALTELVMEAAARLPRRLGHLVGDDLCVAVNVSPEELTLYSVSDLVREVLARTQCPPRQIEIEITEDAILDLDRGAAEVERLLATGVRVAIDDFGAGYSSFASLSRFKVDRIKIDRQFVTALELSRGDRNTQVVRAMIALARSLEAEILAEGVEDAETATRLGLLGCTIAQGFLFGRPMPEAEIPDWIRTWNAQGKNGETPRRTLVRRHG